MATYNLTVQLTAQANSLISGLRSAADAAQDLGRRTRDLDRRLDTLDPPADAPPGRSTLSAPKPYSGGANDCVEVAELGEHAAVRESKDIGRRPLMFSKAAMRALVSGIARGPIGERWG